MLYLIQTVCLRVPQALYGFDANNQTEAVNFHQQISIVTHCEYLKNCTGSRLRYPPISPRCRDVQSVGLKFRFVILRTTRPRDLLTPPPKANICIPSVAFKMAFSFVLYCLRLRAGSDPLIIISGPPSFQCHR